MPAASAHKRPLVDVAESHLADLHFIELIFDFVGFRQNVKEGQG